MQRKILISFVGAFILVLGIGGYYLYKRQSTQNPILQNSTIPTQQVSNQITQSSPTVGATLSDKDAISQAVAQKSGVRLNQLRVTFTQEPTVFNGLYATGQVGPATGAGGGAIWYGAKVNGTWIIVAITQAPISCNLVNQYKLPKSMLNSCLDASGNLITR